jgi:hypothetical protein
LWPVTGGYVLLETGQDDLWPYTAAAIGDDGVILGSVRRSGGGYTIALPYRWNADRIGALLPLPRPLSTESGNVEAMAGQWAVGSAGELPTPTVQSTPRLPPRGYRHALGNLERSRSISS